MSAFGAAACAQDAKSGPWVMQQGGTTASLRGIHAVGGGVAWASGTDGTVLRTEDSGYMWQTCAMPPGAEKLDFRGIWAWDANNAVIMASGPGTQSRVYKTTDGCSHWKVVFSDPLPDGFFDALYFLDADHGVLLGDPVKFNNNSHPIGSIESLIPPFERRTGTLPIRVTNDGGYKWIPVMDGGPQPLTAGGKSGPVTGWKMNPPPGEGLTPLPDEAFFAASNSSIASSGDTLWIGTSKGRVIRVSQAAFVPGGLICGTPEPISGSCPIHWQIVDSAQTPIRHDSPAAGIFSIAFADWQHGIAVGGDYQKPNDPTGTAAWTADGGKTWTAAVKPPHGYRSSVAWDAEAKAWIAAGTNGSDISYDGGKTWSKLDDGNWNAISLPWIVGPKGRIAKLGALPAKP
ncbi:MAG: hypothetical protein QM649_14760 [Silvibacterium sp.]